EAPRRSPRQGSSRGRLRHRLLSIPCSVASSSSSVVSSVRCSIASSSSPAVSSVPCSVASSSSSAVPSASCSRCMPSPTSPLPPTSSARPRRRHLRGLAVSAGRHLRRQESDHRLPLGATARNKARPPHLPPCLPPAATNTSASHSRLPAVTHNDDPPGEHRIHGLHFKECDVCRIQLLKVAKFSAPNSRDCYHYIHFDYGPASLIEVPRETIWPWSFIRRK
ncbi:unnamed protein product, partial [Urochloa humidicola]